MDPTGGPGLLLRLPGLPEGPIAGYCHVSNALEAKVAPEQAAAELGKRFQVRPNVGRGAARAANTL